MGTAGAGDCSGATQVEIDSRYARDVRLLQRDRSSAHDERTGRSVVDHEDLTVGAGCSTVQ